MANNDTPFGLRAIDQVTGAPYNGRVNMYYAPSSYATNIFVGDAVTITGTANTAQVTTGSGSYSAGTIPEVNRTSPGDGNAISGIVVGFDANPTDLEKTFGSASTERVMQVVDDPYALFEIQPDGALAVTQIGLNANLIDATAGSTVNGRSGTELDTTSDVPAADASNQLTILRFIERTDNEVGNFVKTIVRINNHTNAHGVIGI